MRSLNVITFNTLLIMLLYSKPAMAYIGPGLGFGFIMSILGIVFGLIIGLIYFLSSPIIKIIKKIKGKK